MESKSEVSEMGTELFYSEERGTWNVFSNGEWYYEDKDYERAENVYVNLLCPEEDDYYEEVDEYGY